MKVLLITSLILSAVFLLACEPSGRGKDEMEKFSGTPTPTIAPAPTEEPIDQADVVQVDTSLDGDNLSVNAGEQKKTLDCTKYNNVMINTDAAVVTIKGACRKLTINGDRNQVTADAVMEMAFNGTANTVTYSRFPNGKRPLVTQNSAGNTVEHAAKAAVKTAEPKKAK